MTKQFYKDAFGWGFVLWLIGYVPGIVLFMTVPVDLIGWIITPIGIVTTLWVLIKRVKEETLQYYMHLAISWTAIAIVFDYIFNVKMFNLGSSYYKLDIYLYYVITFILPLWVYSHKKIYQEAILPKCNRIRHQLGSTTI